ncbi:DUF551 domain-containing protein [Kosakonia cowanii]|uniref:DUF551 domain-containing protein n=1 Tax=Kosakonia cowanii TaxID=208223 RepID=UPI00289B35E6|nr:DUF551 domain-containing protein [Kosakonia cowanii]
MNTISNERLETIAKNALSEERRMMAAELLALRKERERAEPVAYLSKADVDAGYPHILARKEYSKACPMAVYTAPPEPSFSDDSLPYDPQIAEYEQMMEAEQAQADTTSQQFESLAGKAVGGWIACSERMPDFYYSCLVADEHGDMVIGLPSNLEVSDRKAFCLSNGDLFLATHWQPLPEPPCK